MLDEVIRFACQFEGGVEEWLLQFSPTACVGVDDASAGESGLTPLAVGLPEEDEGEEEEGEGNIKHIQEFESLQVGTFEPSNLQSCQRLNDFRGAIRYEHDQCDHQQNKPNRPREAGCQHLTSMFDVEFSPSREFSLVQRGDALLFVPPGAAAIEVGADVG